MELLNSTEMTAGYTLGMDREGRESLVVAVKGTFAIPGGSGEPFLCERQKPLVEADVFSGEPGFSAPVYECDYAPFKPRCDVVLNGSAYAPQGRPGKMVPVCLKVGPITKMFNVVGNRRWEKGLLLSGVSKTEPFTMMPISYDNAFGGVDDSDKEPSRHRACLENPVGVGFHGNSSEDVFDGLPLPNTEHIGEPVTKSNGKYRPVAFGPVGRGWEPRCRFAGTYDQHWIDNVFPFLPHDFSDEYFQCAPPDQQMGYLQGGEKVLLVNLTPMGRTEFRIPGIEVPIAFFYKKGGHHQTHAVADTLVIEPDENRFMITWRASLPLKKNIFEISQVLAGTMSRTWWRARETGKKYYGSLEELCKSKRQDFSED